MSTPATIGIDDNLTASQAGITLRATNDEEARRLDLNNVNKYEEYAKYQNAYVIDGVVVEVLGGDNLLDDLLHDFLSELLSRDVLAVLSANDNGVHS